MATLYERYNAGDDGVVSFYGAILRGQSFTVGSSGGNTSHIVSSVKAYLYKTGSPGTVYLNLYRASSGLPVGISLATAAYTTPIGDGSVNVAWHEIPFTTGFPLSPSVQYVITLSAPSGNASNLVYWRRDTSSPTYSGGACLYSTDSGATWNAQADYDFMFEEYGDATDYVSGTVTLSGSGVSGATVRAIDMTTGELYVNTTDGDGNYQIATRTNNVHVAVEYESSGTYYNAASLWNVTPDSA